MPISINEVRRIARLAKLDFAPEDLERLSGQLGSILAHIDRLQDLAAAEPPFEAGTGAGEERLRDDRPQPCLGTETALANAPDADGVHFRVPRVIG